MAGFYGNIRNSTSNSFKFDKVYSNRFLMDKNANTDGVFAGRYVLVEYDQEMAANIDPTLVSKTYYQFNDDNQYYSQEPIVRSQKQDSINGYILVHAENDNGASDYVYTKNDIIIKIINVAISLLEENIENVITEEDENSDALYLKLNNVYTYRGVGEYYGLQFNKPYAFDEDGNVILNKVTQSVLIRVTKDENNQELVERIPIRTGDDAYTTNYEVDKYYYGAGRGYDSTVWRKVYEKDGTAKYVNIAELNSVVPTFAVSADKPTDAPNTPHFDRDSTNVYYNLHLQTPWGFRLAPLAQNSSQQDKLISDFLDQSSNTWLNKRLGEIQLDGINETTYEWQTYNDDGSINNRSINYTPAIYINARGFNKKTHYDKSNLTNSIEITKTGKQGVNYNHGANNPYDIKELSVILPAFGNVVSEMWDLMYGDGSDNLSRERKDTILWEDANNRFYSDSGVKLRLITDKDDESGYYYTPIDHPVKLSENPTNPNIDTLAGAINSVHDIMGMIITKDEPLELEDNKFNLYRSPYDDDVYLYNTPPTKIFVETIKDNPDNPDDVRHEFYYAAKGYAYQTVNTDYPDNEFGENSIIESIGSIEGNEDKAYDGYAEIDSSILTKYGGDKYLKIAEWALERDDNEVATAGGEYYNLPAALKYAGVLMQSGLEEGAKYYEKSGNNFISATYTKYEEIPAAEYESLSEEETYYVYDEQNGYQIYDGPLTDVSVTLYKISEAPATDFYTIKEYFEVDESVEPYIPTETYYTYDEYQDKYIEFEKPEDDIYDWDDLSENTEKLYRLSDYQKNKYYVFNNSNVNQIYWFEKRKTDGNKTYIDYEKVYLDNNDQITNLKQLYDFVKRKTLEYENNKPIIQNGSFVAKTDSNGFKYVYGALSRQISSRTEYDEPDPSDPNQVITQHTEIEWESCPLRQFLFDNNDLYEKNDDGDYIKAGFGHENNSARDDITAGLGYKLSFYKIADHQIRDYEDYKYFVFESDDEEIINNPHQVKTQSGLVSVKDLENGILNPNLQSITRLWLSTSGYRPGRDYWVLMINGREVTARADIEKFFTSPVAYGVNDTNINDPDIISPYIPTQDVEKQNGKTYYIKQNEEFVEYNDPWPAENRPVIYEPNTVELYYADDVLYVKDGDNYYLSSFGKDYDGEDLYQERKLYIIDTGDFEGQFRLYQEWNPLIITNVDDYNYYFKKEFAEVTQEEFDENKLNNVKVTYYVLDEVTNKYEPYTEPLDVYPNDEGIDSNMRFKIYATTNHPLVLGKKVNISVKRKLPGFARTLNTIHGLILRINEMLQSGDYKTRDDNTIQGCINKMHDIFAKFEELRPGELFGVDRNGRISSLGFEKEKDGEFWVDLGTNPDANDPSKKNLHAFHTTINEFVRYAETEDQTKDPEKQYYIKENGEYIEYNDAWPQEDAPTIYEIKYVEDPDLNEELADCIDELKDALVDGDMVSAPFGYATNNTLEIKVPVIDNAGHTVGIKSSSVKLIDLLLGDGNETGNDAIISEYPLINTDDNLGDALQTIITHVNEGADNITLNNYNNYYNDAPYFITEDETKDPNKQYYIKQNNEFVEYNDAWPEQNRPIIYEKETVVDNNDNLNKAIAKLQWQIDDHKQKQLTVSGTGNVVASLAVNDGAITATMGYVGSQLLTGYSTTSDTTDIAATDTVNQAIGKLQAQFKTVDTKIENAKTDIVNNYCGIIRAAETQVPSSVPNTNYYNENLKSGWIWVDTTNHYIYIKTQDGYKLNYTDEIDRNYWELLNAWQ